MSIKQLTILGAGLMGGSIALAARKANWAHQIIAIDRKLPANRISESRNAFESSSPKKDSSPQDPFDAWCDASDEPACESWLAQSDLTLLAMPVLGIGLHLEQVLQATTGCVSDIGSTKAWLVESIQKSPGFQRYIPGHPMAGHPVGGLSHARADLFIGRPWIICPENSNAQHLDTISSLISACGAHEVRMSPAEHDHAVARTSHIPQIIASALSVLADGRASEAIGPGFLSATRVAGGAEEMWRDIFKTNHQAIAEGLNAFIANLEAVREEFSQQHPESGDLTQTLKLLQRARLKKEGA